MALISCFYAKLECQNCHRTAPQEIAICNSLIDNGKSYNLHVGDKVPDLVIGDFTDEYLTVNPPKDDARILVLEDWECPVCHGWQWAELTFERSVWTQATAVLLDKNWLETVNFVTTRIDQPYEWIVGKPMYQAGKLESNFIEILKSHLHL